MTEHTNIATTMLSRSEAAHLKVATLCHGLQFPIDLFAQISSDFYDNQYVYGRTSPGALRSHRLPQALCLGHDIITAVLRRPASPLSLCVMDGRVIVAREERIIGEAGLPARPPFFDAILSDGRRSQDFIAVAGESSPGFFLQPDCHYFRDGVPCKFCSLRHTRNTAGKDMADVFDVAMIAEATHLFQHTPWKDIPIISVTTGTFPDNDEGARYTACVVDSIYRALDPKIPIHLLTMPPDSLDLIDLYRQAGATSIAFNLEVFDPAIFAEVCPGKERAYGYKKMLEAMSHAASVFGPYNAFCGFVWGLEPVQSLIRGYQWCFDRGISISSNVFHADQGSLFAKRAHPDEETVLSLCARQAELYRRYPSAKTIFPCSMRSTLDWEIFRGDFR